MTDRFKPMLSSTFELSESSGIRFPVLVSPKLDGVRALIRSGVVYSRNLKPIPNLHVQRLFGDTSLDGLDGELIVGNSKSEDVYRSTCSGVMSIDGEPSVMFYAFDFCCETYASRPFKERLAKAHSLAANHSAIKKVVHKYAHDISDIQRLEEQYLDDGYEGLMIRSPDGPYKHGRATNREGYLFKMKRFSDSEAEIIGYEELFSNQNIAEVSELGNTKRSTHKDNMVPMNTLGALMVRDVHTGIEFSIGSGFTQQLRDELWNIKESSLMGMIIKYKYFSIGVKDKPRFPVFLGFRSKIDF